MAQDGVKEDIMSVILKQYPGQEVTPEDDGKLYDFFALGETCIVTGCGVTSLGGNQLRIADGWGLIKGRQFVVEAQTVNATLSTSGTVDGRLILEVDLGATPPIAFKTQKAPLSALTQQDINAGGTVYQMPLATYRVSTASVSDITVVANAPTDVKGLIQTLGASVQSLTQRQDIAMTMAGDTLNIIG